MFTVVGYYTIGTPYEQEILMMRASVEQFGIKTSIKGFYPRKSWLANVSYKPQFIKECLETIDTDIVYLDADAVMHEYPYLFDDIHDDIGVHYWRRRSEYLAGTLYVKNNKAGRDFISHWDEVQSQNLEVLDLIIFKRLIREAMSKGLKVFQLPASYAQIFDLMKDSGQPVISHMQASRRYKYIMNRWTDGSSKRDQKVS